MSDCRTFLVGEGLLALHTLSALLEHGFPVCGVLSADESLRTECTRRGVASLSSRKEFEAAVHATDFELLFSVNNSWLLPPTLLAAPKRFAINFHDAPLPKYGGLFATSWALLRGETSHGVSWHVMDAGVDTGDLLEQRSVPVHPDDTAHTLNARCFEAACDGLRTLLPRLATGDAQPKPQDPSAPRSYFGLADRPWAAAVLDWSESAETLARQVRALDFGTVQNPFAAAKCALLGEFPIVTSARAVAQTCAQPPGTYLGYDAGGLLVATGAGVLALSALSGADGTCLDLAALASHPRLVPGAKLEVLSEEHTRALDARFRAWARHEGFWLRKLMAAQPYGDVLPRTTGSGEMARHELPRFSAWLRAHRDGQGASSDFAGTLITSFIARMAEAAEGDIGWLVPPLSTCETAVFSPLVPMRLEVGQASLRTHAARYAETLAAVEKRGSYARDLVARTPSLRGRAPHYPLAVALAELSPRALSGLATDALFCVAPGGKGAAIYVRGSFPEHASTLASLDTALATFAAAAVAEPERPLIDLPVLDPDTERRITETWNDTATEYPREASLLSLFSAQAARTPDAPAVRDGTRALSYRELDARSDALAAQLSARGVTRGSRVLVSMTRDVGVLIALLAVWKVGAAYVPVDPDAPPGRRSAIVASAQPCLALCDARSEAAWRAVSARLVVDVEALAHAPEHAAPGVAGHADDIAYVIFTSGSTGAPKGVEVQQRGLVNHALAVQQRYGLGAGDRMLCSASIGFDVLGEQLYPALLGGAEVTMGPSDVFDSIARFEAFLRQFAITCVILPTGFWHEWMRALDERAAPLPDALRLVCVGTEKVQRTYLSIFQRISGGRARFLQGYGPTEATITCTMYEPPENDANSSCDVPIGRPLSNVRTYVLDHRLRPRPVGFAGELYVAGDGLARGYLGAPELTCARFVADPFVAGARMYRTGDRARFTPEGALVFLGRTDHQVKVRGHRVELGEIEAALGSLPQVAQAAVMHTRGANDTAQLVAYVVPSEPEAGLDTSALRSDLAMHVPDYMLPSAWVVLPELPRSTSQKLDRQALLLLTPRSARPQVAARTPREVALAALVAEHFGGCEVGPDADFFRDLGGDSLLAVRLMARIEQTYGVALSLSAFTREPTVAYLARTIEARSLAPEVPSHVLLNAGDHSARTPLWLLPAIGGHVVYGHYIREHVPADQPIYGIEAQGLDGQSAPPATIEAMASGYLEIILRAQPRGPYVIAAPSVGGLIAWELGQRLRARGEHAVVAMMDTWGPGYPRILPAIERLRDQFGTLRRQRSAGALLTLVKQRLRARMRILLGASPYEVVNGIEGLRGQRIRAVVDAFERASLMYRAAPFAGDVVLFHAGVHAAVSGMRFEAADNGWSALCQGSLRVVPVEVDHSTLADRPPQVVAEVLMQIVDATLTVPAALGEVA